MQTIQKTELIQSLRSTRCPACQGLKIYAQTVCPKCYKALPKAMRTALYAPVGKGYHEAVQAAMAALGVNEFHLPPAENQG